MSSPPVAGAKKARFTSGSTMRHVVVLTTTGSIGLVAIFFVDFANLFYISLLRDPSLTAAVGYASTILYFYVSLCIGLMIAGTALVSRALGAEDHARARRLAGSALTTIVLASSALSLASLPFVDALLHMIGAEGRTEALAAWFMRIVLPTTPLIGLVMGLSGLLRASGDPKRAMYTTLIFGGVTAALDPLLIFVFGLGITGAAIVTVIARLAGVAYGFYALARFHDVLGRPTLKTVVADLRPLAAIGIPAVLTNIATPVGNGYLTAAIATFGDHAVAGLTIISRLTPVAFGVLFALSGSLGPIIGQNLGARAFDRVRQTITDSLIFTALYMLAICLILYLGRNAIVAFFGASGDDAALVIYFCEFIAASYIFSAAIFVSNAAFNNLGHPLFATLFNWGRATIGTIPFVYVGAKLGGAEGALAGFAIGSIPFGVGALAVCYRVIGRLGHDPADKRSNLRALLAMLIGRRSATPG
jgi:putative MATE family efflux protein